FSSIGNSADGRIKPDVMAMGRACATVGPDGSLYRVNGTSFSCPILAGAVTCLWQAYPNLRPTDIIQAVCNAGDRADYPDNIFGHGIPNMWRAYELLKDMK
ncbi:MAG: S8 family serine peptidase, partial [Alloprevotella sp.]